MITKTPLSVVREVLATADSVGCPEAGRIHGYCDQTVYRWWKRRMREHNGWPTPEDVTADDAYRAATAARRHRHAVNSNRQRMAWTRRGGQPLYIDATGTMRRLQALCALGWTALDLAPMLGVTNSRVSNLLRGLNPTVHPDTAATVTALYDRLSMTIPTHYPPWLLDRNRRRAAEKRWALPLLWDSDEQMNDPSAVADWGSRITAA